MATTIMAMIDTTNAKAAIRGLCLSGIAMLSIAPSVHASPRQSQDSLYSIYNSSSATPAAKYHAWKLLRRKNPGLLRPMTAMQARRTIPDASGFIIAAKGGRVARADGAAVALPPGALSGGALIVISTAAVRSEFETALRARKMDAAGLIAVSSAVAFGPEAMPLKAPATFALPYDASKLPALGLSQFDLRIYRWNRDKQTWDWLPTTAKTDGLLTTQASFLAVYQVLARRPQRP